MDFVIITAGGIGKRMGTDAPKQFLTIGGKPILMRSIDAFYEYNKSIKIILSLPKEHIYTWKTLCTKYNYITKHIIVEGGETRFHSIKNALNKVSGDGIVAVHDGVRPLVNKDIIEDSFISAKKNGSGVASNNINFSIRKLNCGVSFYRNRELYKEIQTPQTFKVEILKKAYKQNYRESFTDDASVVEKDGSQIFLTKGNSENIKITTPFDIILAESILKKQS